MVYVPACGSPHCQEFGSGRFTETKGSDRKVAFHMSHGQWSHHPTARRTSSWKARHTMKQQYSSQEPSSLSYSQNSLSHFQTRGLQGCQLLEPLINPLFTFGVWWQMFVFSPQPLKRDFLARIIFKCKFTENYFKNSHQKRKSGYRWKSLQDIAKLGLSITVLTPRTETQMRRSVNPPRVNHFRQQQST